MDPNQIKETIAALIHKLDPSAEAFLFGSRARSEHQQNSDWDILILVENEKVTNDIED